MIKSAALSWLLFKRSRTEIGLTKSNVFRMFRSQYRGICHVCSFLECTLMIQEVADVYHMFVVLCGRKQLAKKKVLITL